ncbi:ArsR/SmtB family transcription factor [Thermonema rossianum]|uniref:ArsR/SmtB family transcription factor n=1 Tax=Thermonema rossianum TaxID=55505 RepID=UPI00056E4137|nr:metalloregulator ArsR/SmtB family transcription factor [Thermonema rossianum]
MGITKSNLFSEEQNRLSTLLKVLAHPARIAILQHLASTPGCINTDLVQELGLAQATVSQHLKALKEAGIIQGSIEGNCLCYCIDTERWQEVKQQIMSFLSEIA